MKGRDQGLKRGRGINALFELCKIAAWERRGVCLSITVTMWQKRLSEGESKGKSRDRQHDQHGELKTATNLYFA